MKLTKKRRNIHANVNVSHFKLKNPGFVWTLGEREGVLNGDVGVERP